MALQINVSCSCDNWKKVAWVPFQYPIRRLIVRSRKVLMTRYRVLKCPYHFEIWQSHPQQCCRGADRGDDRTILNTNPAASRLCAISQKHVLSDIIMPFAHKYLCIILHASYLMLRTLVSCFSENVFRLFRAHKIIFILEWYYRNR